MKNPVIVLVFLILFVASGCSIFKSSFVYLKDGSTFPVTYFSVDEIYFFRISETLYASDLEITQERYKEFLKEIEVANPEKFKVCVVDTSVWKKYSFAGEYMPSVYFQNTRYKKYPIVGISWEAANEYCQWLTEKAKSKFRHNTIQIRLPTEEEWRLMIAKPNKDGFDVPCPNGFDNVINCYCFNHWVVDTVLDQAQDGGYYTVAADAYWANRYGIRNAHGNVAEMTSDKQVCKGGGWYDSFSNCSMYKSTYYPLPSAEVGFRPIAIISKK